MAKPSVSTPAVSEPAREVEAERHASRHALADQQGALVRQGYWLDVNDQSIVLVTTQGIGAHLTNDEKRAHLTDLKRKHLIDLICIQEILPPEES
jgi:hypothetical protein